MKEKDLKMHNPPHPGEILKELYLEPLGVTVTFFAIKIGVRRATASDLINGKSGITAKMAIKLGKAFNTTPELWLGLQLQYDLWQEEQRYSGDDVQVMYG
jgi:addiction module HigA family antidote